VHVEAPLPVHPVGLLHAGDVFGRRDETHHVRPAEDQRLAVTPAFRLHAAILGGLPFSLATTKASPAPTVSATRSGQTQAICARSQPEESPCPRQSPGRRASPSARPPTPLDPRRLPLPERRDPDPQQPRVVR